ncbi:hypothetical protein BDV93DRAFT_550681 [Ceratobasidium sp. AG-I]|nr:hypothetical protein BDV93DRAFT_550681 [Ceratobasidium sp. AG-I]
MGYTLDESDSQGLQELLDAIYAPTYDEEAFNSALVSLKTLIEKEDATADSDDGDEADEEVAPDDEQDKIPVLKQHILTTKPDFFKHLTNIPNDSDAEEDFWGQTYKAELVAEMLRDSPPCKLAFIPCIDDLLRYAFRVNPDDSNAIRGRYYLFKYPIAELLRPDPNAEDAHRAVVEALSSQVKALSDYLPSDLSASAMTEDLANKQKALAFGLQSLAELPLKPDAVPAFIQAGGLDALLGVLARGPLSLPDVESPNDSLEYACCSLAKLAEEPPLETLAEAFVERQAAVSLIKQMTYVCGLEGVYSASSVPRSLLVLAKANETLRKQVVAEAQKIIASNPGDYGPGAGVVLLALIEGAETHDIKEMNKVSKSKNYVSFFLTPCEPGVDDAIMGAAGDALALCIFKPGHRLQKGVTTPELVEKLVNLLEWACTQSAPDISSSMQVLRELVLPTSEENTGGFIDSDENLKRVNRPFCRLFGKAIKTRCDAARALASKETSDEKNEEGVQEPSEEGLANMKNVRMLKVLVEEQYTTIALLAEDLLDYQLHLLCSPSPLTRRAGLEFLDALCHESSLLEDFKYVPDIIDAFKAIVVHMLGDPRAIIRALALQWLGGIMGYRHPKSENIARYKPGIDFVMESVSEEKLVAMLKGNGEEAKVAAEVVSLMARHSTGMEVRDRLKRNEELVELLWNGVFWDEDKAPPNEDEDISEDIWVYGNIEISSGEALTEILNPFTDRASIVAHITPRLEQFNDKEPTEFSEFVEKLPAIASLAVLTPETGVLSRLSEMIANEEQLPYAMQALRHLSQGSMLAKVSLGQSDHIYPAIVKLLQEGTDDSKTTVLLDLEAFLSASTVSRTRFMKEGGIKALLDIIPSDDATLSNKAASTLVSFLTDFPEGAQPTIDAGATPILESKKDEDDIFDRVGSALTLLEELKTAPPVERIEFTPDAYAAFGKKLSDPAALEQLKKNLESSQDEKQLAVVAGLPTVLTDLLRSSSEPKLLLQVLQTLFVIDGLVWDGYTIALNVAQRCGLWEVLKSFVGNEDAEVSDLAANIRSAIVTEWNDELREEDDEEDEEDGEQENEVEGKDEEEEEKEDKAAE